MEVLRLGYRVLFMSDPPLSAVPIPLPSYSPLSIKGKALQGEIEALIAKEAVDRPFISRFLQSPVRGPEGFGVVEACHRPVVFERFCSANTVQDGVKPVSAPVHQELRLDDLHQS